MANLNMAHRRQCEPYLPASFVDEKGNRSLVAFGQLNAKLGIPKEEKE